jgi:hypothetical protein
VVFQKVVKHHFSGKEIISGVFAVMRLTQCFIDTEHEVVCFGDLTRFPPDPFNKENFAVHLRNQEIRGSYSGEDVGCGLLGCDAV